MNEATRFGLSRSRRQALRFLSGLALVVVGSVASAAFGEFDVLVRVVGYAMALSAAGGHLRDRLAALRGRLGPSGGLSSWLRARLPF